MLSTTDVMTCSNACEAEFGGKHIVLVTEQNVYQKRRCSRIE